MKTGSLFSGIGGLELGLGVTARWHCENDKHAAAVLDRHWNVPNLGDITSVDWATVEPVDLLVGGFPCQDISSAGQQAGISEGTRSGLWSHYIRAICHLRPSHVFVENVAALLAVGMGRVLGDLAEAGYDAEWTSLRASDVGAPHRRERIFIHSWPAGHVGVASSDPFPQAGRSRDSAGEPSGAAADPTGGGDRAEAGDQALGSDTSRSPSRLGGSGHGDDAFPADAESVGRGSGRGRRAIQRLEVEGESPLESGGRSDALPADTDGGGFQGGREQDQRPVESEQPTSRRDDADRRSASTPRWGPYGAAISRWEPIVGRSSPDPVDGKGRLAVSFVEWMMGFPEGWVDGLTRTAALRCLGNAVVPQQAARAWSELVGSDLTRTVATTWS